MIIGLIVFFGLSFLIIAHEAGHFFVAKLFKLRIDEFGFGFPPKMFGKKRGETEYTLNWLPFGGFVRIAGENDRLSSNDGKLAELPNAEKRRIFMFQAAWKRALIIGAGVFVNFLIGWWILAGVYLIGTPQKLLVTGVQERSPAADVGFKTGDVLTDFKTSNEFIAFVNRNRGETIRVMVERNREQIVLEAVPRTETREGEGALGVLLGETGIPRHGFFDAFRASLVHAAGLFWYTVISFGHLITQIVTQASVPEGVAGPVGIFSVAQEAGALGLIYLLQLLSLISINLSVLNLIPFPALDGGRLFLILIEKIKGSPVSVRFEAMFNGLGFIFLMIFIVMITVNDVMNLF